MVPSTLVESRLAFRQQTSAIKEHSKLRIPRERKKRKRDGVMPWSWGGALAVCVCPKLLR